MRFPRPSYPIAGNLFLGLFLIAWGLWVTVFPGDPHHAVPSLHWFWNGWEEHVVAFGAVFLGATKILCILNDWQATGKVAATFATGLWLQLGVKAFIAAPGIHLPICAFYFCAAGCSIMTMLTEERE
jgi:hypothetical protein